MKYQVKVAHPVGWFPNGQDTIIVEVNESGTMFYATSAKLGCGKDFTSPMHAIQGLLRDHALRIVKIDTLA